jgi:Na+/proline symporter
MTNKRNTEMAKKAAILGLFGLLVIIIIGVALAIYFGTKKSDDDETSDKPEFT